MKTITRFALWFSEEIRSEKGASMAEYGLITVLIAILAITAASLAGVETSEMYSTIGDTMSSAG